MSTKILLRIILISFLVFSSIVCKKDSNPIEVENKSPVILSDAWALLPNLPGDMIWEMSIGPDGILYAGVESGLVRSADNGLSWEQIYSSTPNEIYVSPYDGMILLSLTGTFTTTTCYSTDNGLTWKQSNEQPGSSISHYVSLPGGELLAGGFVHDESSGGIFRSNDKAVTWKRVPDLEKEPSVRSFALNSANDVYTLLASGLSYSKTTIFYSKDKGQSWLQLNKPDSLIIRNLVINRRSALVISTDNCIYISENNIGNWKPLYPPFQNGFIYRIGLDSNDNILVTFFDLEDRLIKVLIYSELTNNWYSIEGINMSSEFPINTLIGKDRHIYLSTFDSGIYKTRQSIDSILMIN